MSPDGTAEEDFTSRNPSGDASITPPPLHTQGLLFHLLPGFWFLFLLCWCSAHCASGWHWHFEHIFIYKGINTPNTVHHRKGLSWALSSWRTVISWTCYTGGQTRSIMFFFFFLFLQYFVFVDDEGRLCGEPHRAVTVYLTHFGNLGKEKEKWLFHLHHSKQAQSLPYSDSTVMF